jgi:Zn-dependent peptidase ImmA (M78 family)
MRPALRARKAAEKVLQTNRVISFPVRVDKIAQVYALLVYEQMDDDISGILLPLQKSHNGKDWAIVVNKTHARVRQRFTVAHELGHLILHGYTTPHADRGYKLRFRSSTAAQGSVWEEVEANQFAAELLMPEGLLLEKLVGEGLEYVPAGDEEDDPRLTKLAHELRVSRQALAIRLSTLLL